MERSEQSDIGAAVQSARALVALPAFGFGGASIGNLFEKCADADADAALSSAVEQGLNYIDTAPFYGHGLSERRIGSWLGTRSVRPVLSTKIGRVLRPIKTQSPNAERQGFVGSDPNEAYFDYSYDGVMRSFEGSLDRLGCEKVDILLAHDLGEMTHGAQHLGHYRTFLDSGYKAMRGLQDAGLVGNIGVGVNEIEVAVALLEHCDLDVILLAGRYTLLEQRALEVLFPLCLERHVSVIIGGAYNSGILFCGVEGSAIVRHNYTTPSPEIIARVQVLQKVCARHGVPLAAAAIQFPLGHSAVTSVISGLSSADQVRHAVQLQQTAIPSDFWSELKDRKLIDAAAPTPSQASDRLEQSLCA
jgi:D-threo-aldose 1-dehydrogenase